MTSYRRWGSEGVGVPLGFKWNFEVSFCPLYELVSVNHWFVPSRRYSPLASAKVKHREGK